MSARVVLCLLILGRELWELFLSRLAAKQRKRPLPTEVADIYNAERGVFTLGYAKMNSNFRVFTSCLPEVSTSL